jgi:hypothetical protein
VLVENCTAQAISVIELHQRLRDLIACHCVAMPMVRSIQMACGLVATPYPLCNMLPAIHLRALLFSQPPMSTGSASRTPVLFHSWRRSCLVVTPHGEQLFEWCTSHIRHFPCTGAVLEAAGLLQSQGVVLCF